MNSSDGLYFILNPVLGIIKIGVTGNLEHRKRTLECSCGVGLVVMRFVPGAQKLEHDLHIVFDDSRLLGEWFAPSPELLGLADGDEDIAAFLERNATTLAAHAAAIFAAREAEKEAYRDMVREEREELERLAAERRRIEAEREAKRERNRLAKVAREAARLRDATEQWVAKKGDVSSNPHWDVKAANLAEERRQFVSSQRARNAALLGISHTGVAANA